MTEESVIIKKYRVVVGPDGQGYLALRDIESFCDPDHFKPLGGAPRLSDSVPDWFEPELMKMAQQEWQEYYLRNDMANWEPSADQMYKVG